MAKPLPSFFVFSALLLLAAGVGRAGEAARTWQSFATRTVGIETGLPSNGAQTLYQTRDGYLWLGTEAGLARYDGVQLQVFRRNDTPGFPDNLIRAFHEDPEGGLWIGSQAGLTVYRDGQFERVAQFDGMEVATIAGDAAGRLWVGTTNGLWERVEEAFVRRPLDGAPGGPGILRIIVDRRGRLWVGFAGGGLGYLENGKFVEVSVEGAKFPVLTRMAEGAQGTIWIATAAALFRWRDGVLVRWVDGADFDGEQITAVLPDSNGQIWLIARHPWVAANAESRQFHPVSVPVDFCRAIIQDREGSYWVGTAGSGVAQLRPSAFRPVTGLPRADLRTLATDPAGAVWAGVRGMGLLRIAPDGALTQITLGGGTQGEVLTHASGLGGEIWFGTAGALGRWHNGEVRRFPELTGVRTIFRDRAGTMWFGDTASGQIWQHRAGEFVPLPGSGGVGGVSVLTDDATGALYAGFVNGGVMKFAGGTRTVFDRASGLPDSEVRALHVDRAGNLWVGGKRRGLSVLSGGRWYNPDTLSVPFGDLVNGIVEDEAGNFWLGTAQGLVWASQRHLLAVARGEETKLKFHLAGPAEGVRPGGIGYGLQPEWCRTPDGVLWFAARTGTVTVRPAEVLRNAVPPPVDIGGVTVDGRRQQPPPRELVLAAGVRSLAIDYTALSFVQPGRVMFRYRLEGHDREWVDAGTRRQAFYSNLPPGKYRFQVIAANEDDVWNDTGATLSLVQRPWFYQTWWFYVVVVVAAGAAITLIYLWRTAGLRRVVRDQTEQIRRQLEKETRLNAEIERVARLESLGVLAGGIAHDFNNLLTVVIANLGLAAMDRRAVTAVGPVLAEAERGAKRAAELTQQLLTFAKGGDPVRAAVSLPDVVREAAEFARHGSKIRCDLEVAPDLEPANVDRGQIGRVVHNLVLNATQAMPAGGVVRLGLANATVRANEMPTLAAGRYVKLSIADTGAGIPAEHLSRIFDPYFSTKPSNNGLGLATVHSIVKKHEGHVTVESTVGRGTTFHIWLPAASERPAPVAPPASAPMLGGAARVLFMDDETIIRRVAEAFLQRLGYDATLVADGAAAVKEYEAARRAGHPYAVVVLDLTVPGGMGGREAMEALRALDPNVRAIVSSGYSSDPVLANFRAYGFSAVVPKPYEVQALAGAIQEVMGSVQPVVVAAREDSGTLSGMRA